MRFIIFSSAIVSSAVGAGIDGNAACQSVCGRIVGVDVANDCKRVLAKADGTCGNLYENPTSRQVIHEIGTPASGLVPFSVQRAADVVRAPEDNCYAMCYGIPECRAAGGSYCEANGVCGRLFWNQFSSNVTASGPDYQYLVADESRTQSSVNQASAVLCDSANEDVKKVPEQDLKGFVDTCKELCALTHTADECKLVQRNGDVCHRLFWANDAKEATEFSVRKERGSQVKITAQEAFDRLLAENNSCENLCKAHPECKRTESHCRKDNRTCHNLFYYPGSVNRKDFRICHGPSCTDGAAITCRLENDAVELFNANPVTPAAANGAPVVANADAAAGTTTPKNAGLIGSTAIAIIASIAVLVL